jgi:hypothetical protein
MKRIKHNDLLPWFTDDHRDLPPAYLKPAARNFLTASSSKPQAPSPEQRAASVKQQATNRKEKMLEIFIIFTSLFILNMLGVFTVTI